MTFQTVVINVTLSLAKVILELVDDRSRRTLVFKLKKNRKKIYIDSHASKPHKSLCGKNEFFTQ